MRCSDPKFELVFVQLVRVLRKLLEACFSDEVKDAFAYPGELKTGANNSSFFLTAIGNI